MIETSRIHRSPRSANDVKIYCVTDQSSNLWQWFIFMVQKVFYREKNFSKLMKYCQYDRLLSDRSYLLVSLESRLNYIKNCAAQLALLRILIYSRIVKVRIYLWLENFRTLDWYSNRMQSVLGDGKWCGAAKSCFQLKELTDQWKRNKKWPSNYEE